MKPTVWEMYGETHTFPILWEFPFPILWERYRYPSWPNTKVKPRLWEMYGTTHTFSIIWVTFFPYYGNFLGTNSHTVEKIWELISILWETYTYYYIPIHFPYYGNFRFPHYGKGMGTQVDCNHEGETQTMGNVWETHTFPKLWVVPFPVSHFPYCIGGNSYYGKSINQLKI